MFCEKCGSSLPEDSKFCGSCGTKTEMQAAHAVAQGQPAHAATVSAQSPPAAPPVATPQTPPTHTAQPGVEPLSVGEYIVTFLLMMIPIVGIILLFRWSFGGGVNLNKKNMARAYLIFFAVWFVIILIGGGAMMGVLEAMMR